MNPNSIAILTNPHPCGHIVYPYTDENLVARAVCLFTSAGVQNGEGIILIMTADHCEPFERRLQLEGFNVEALKRSGQLVCAKSEELLQQFLTNGSVDEDLFKTTVSGLIARAAAGGRNGKPRKVRCFGEMVSQLRATDLTATTRLEELWNELIDEHSVALLCTYALQDGDDQVPQSLVTLHSHNIEQKPAAVV